MQSYECEESRAFRVLVDGDSFDSGAWRYVGTAVRHSDMFGSFYAHIIEKRDEPKEDGNARS